MKYSAAHSADSNLRLLIKGSIDPFAKNKSGARMAANAVAGAYCNACRTQGESLTPLPKVRKKLRHINVAIVISSMSQQYSSVVMLHPQ
jgi:hypothetical protein